MPKSYKLPIALILSLLILALIYYGSILPFWKSRLYAKALEELRQQPRSLESFLSLFQPALGFYSPVGQDEIVSAYLGLLSEVISQQSNKQVVDVLVKEAEVKMKPILEKSKGFNLGQSLHNLGAIYATAAVKFNDETYYQKAVEMFRLGLKHSPNRQMFLYSLFKLYQFKGDTKGMREIGEIILKYWPENDKIREIIDSL